MATRTTSYADPKLLQDEEAFARHRDQEMARRAEFAKLYPNEAAAADANIANNAKAVGVSPEDVLRNIVGRNEEEDEKLAEVRKVHRRMSEVGTIPATIVWLHPWLGQGDGRYLMYGDMTIPACPIGQVYAVKIIRHYKVDIEDKGGRFGADVITPIALANDLHQQFDKLKRGGMFRYMGDHNPGEQTKTRDAEMKMWDRAKKEQVRYYRQEFRVAESYAQQGLRNGIKNITDNHRDIAKWLLHYKYITNLPPWVTATRDEGDIPDTCPRCGADVSEVGFACRSCPYIIDPYRAFQANEIEEEHHSLRRLSREQLNELGLQHVQTLEEYRTRARNGSSEAEEEKSPVRRGNKGKGKSLGEHLAEKVTQGA